MTLRARLLLALVGIVAAGLIVSGIVTYSSLRSYLYSQVDVQLQPIYPSMGRLLDRCLSEGGFCQFQLGGGYGPAGAPAELTPLGTFGQLDDQNGNKEISGFVEPAGTVAPPAPVLPADLSVTTATFFSASSHSAGGVDYRLIAVPYTDSTTGFVGTLIVGLPLTNVHHTLGRLLAIETLVSIGMLAALGGLAWWIVRRSLRPLDAMAVTAGAIAAGDLSQRVSAADDYTEVGRLGSALNTMLGEIEEAFSARAASEERLRRFLADASHELRTPLTSIRGYAEMFDRGARDRPEDLATSMRHIRAEADRMSTLVEDLLLLARVDRERPLEHEPVELGSVVAPAVDAARVAGAERTVSLQVPQPVWVRGDAARLRQVVDNLLGNALKYTPPGSPVEVAVDADPAGARAVLQVADHGPGVPHAERTKVFEPFHRSDTSRARATGGVGLGLAIVSAIVRAHGGDSSVSDRPDGGSGACFRVTLPLVPPSSPPSVASDGDIAAAPTDGDMAGAPSEGADGVAALSAAVATSGPHDGAPVDATGEGIGDHSDDGVATSGRSPLQPSGPP